ncbi:NlpC/P60 family protein [Streptomyces sp. VRA16 Mangrove soil]|uniref:C40 family peptidase n=1 Tax=Streptomyces sp. VRA16 Mangrove soil TaxID=2817434 RepID=UPI001A9ED6F6|nr:NlpC/P60 family protein [Streptomyces sp. VRA16 Mangrove soil]MBO1333352.1 C40 family peptidase [Streptomyces sp. VRA16 Mangrove soil]
MGSHRRIAPSGFELSTRVTVLTVAAAGAAAALGAVPAGAAPQDRPADTKAEVDRLYEQAEQATESYNKADERAGQLRKDLARTQDEVARGQERINKMRQALGMVAGAQYRSGGMDPSLALMLSSDPDGYLDRASTMDRISARQADELAELQDAQRELAQERAEARRKLGELEQSRKAVARHKRTVETKLAKARRLLNSMAAPERAAYEQASRGGARPDLSGAGPASSSRAAAALAAAQSALGRPYVWGGNGPSGFDCSGLMQWSYARAGVSLPRTSQEQRYAGRQVSLSEARPGDLVIYRGDASHVGIYAGNGQVIHAPYPGAPVRYDPVGMMPVSSVTRP